MRLLAVLLINIAAVLSEECTETLTKSPGNITQFTTTSPVAPEHTAYCDYVIQAPSNYVIELNLTGLHPQDNPRPSSGRYDKQKSTTAAAESENADDNHSLGGRSRHCAPNIVVVEMTGSGRDLISHLVCLLDQASSAVVLRSKSHRIRIHYSWDPHTQLSFTLAFVFHKLTALCGGGGTFSCNDGHCLYDTNLICNGAPDCPDRSDEHNCQYQPPDNNSNNQFLLTLIIVIFVVGIIFFVGCMVVHFRVFSLFTRVQDRSHRSSQILSSHDHNREVLYVQGTSLDALIQGERQLRNYQIQTDTQLNLPPVIPISADGEEGYFRSQRNLQLSCHIQPKTCRQSIRPPPNKAVYPGDSPPSYRAHHAGRAPPSCVSCDDDRFLPPPCFHGTLEDTYCKQSKEVDTVSTAPSQTGTQ